MSEPNEYDGIPLSRILPMWRQQVKKLSLEANALQAENECLKANAELDRKKYYGIMGAQLTEIKKLKANNQKLKNDSAKYEVFNAVVWRSAHTAPKDGSFILTYNHDNSGGTIRLVAWCDTLKCWDEATDHGCVFTHWMPIPKRPNN